MPLPDILVHSAVRIREEGSGEWVEGSRDVGPVESTPFDCVLFLPTPGNEQSRGGRQVKYPLLMYEPYDVADTDFELRREDSVRITAAEEDPAVRLLIEGTVEKPIVWQVEGDPQPLGKPGELVKGMQARLKQVSP